MRYSFIVLWTTRHDRDVFIDTYEVFEDLTAARRLYDVVKDRTSTMTASLVVPVESTDYECLTVPGVDARPS